MISGTVTIEGNQLKEADGMEIKDFNEVTFSIAEPTELLLFDVSV